MGAKLGPRIVADNLVLALDCADVKSYAGEPTTNLVTSSAVDFSVMSGYTGNTFSQVVDSESPSGYACEMSYTGTVNSASRCKFGAATNIPTSGTGFVSIWAKRSAGSSTTMRPKVYTGYAWYHLEPLDGGSIYFTNEYRPFGIVVTFGTNSGGPNPGFSMTHAGGSTENDKTRWIKPQVTTSSYNVPFANLSRSTTNGWVDLSGNSNDGTLVNDVATGISHYRSGDVILPNSARYLDSDGSDQYIDLGTISSGDNLYISQGSIELWFKYSTSQNGAILGWGDASTNWGNIAVTNNWTGSVSNESIAIGSRKSSTDYYTFYVTDGADYYGDGNWHHLVFTKGVDNSTNIACYIDGVQKTMSVAKAGTGAFFLDNVASSQINIGRRPYSGGSEYYNGNVASIKIYSDILTQAEALQNYNSAKSRFS